MCIRDRFNSPINFELFMKGTKIKIKIDIYNAITPVSYTHLDVYKRQHTHTMFFYILLSLNKPRFPSSFMRTQYRQRFL